MIDLKHIASKFVDLTDRLLSNRKVIKNISLLLGIIVFCYYIVFSMIYGNLSSLVLCASFLGIGIAIFYRKKRYTQIFVWVYLLSVLSTIALYHIYISRYSVPYYNGGSDDLMYETLIRNLADKIGFWDQEVVHSIIITPARDYFAYIYPQAQIARFANLLGDVSIYDFRLFNCLLNALCSLMIFRLCSKHLKLNEKISFYTAILCAGAPFCLYITANLFRDIWVTFLILVIVLSSKELFLETKYYTKVILWIVIAAALYILYYSRMLVNWLMIFYITADVFWVFFTLPKEQKRSPKIRRAFIVSAILVTVNMVILFSTGFFSIARITNKIAYINDTYEQYYQEQYNQTPTPSKSPDKTPTIPDKTPNSTMPSKPIPIDKGVRFTDKILKMPLPQGLLFRYPLLIFTPVPRFTSFYLDDIFIKIGTCFRFFIIPYLLYGIFTSIKVKRMTDIAGLFVIMFLMVGMTTFTFRHIIMMYPFAAITSAQGYSVLSDKARIKKIFFWFSLGLLLLYQIVSLAL